MLADSKRSHLARYLPHVLLATFSVAIAPLLAVYMLERYGVVKSSFGATAVGVGLSVGLARLGTWAWMRHSGSRDLVFGDLMLWGWIRRVRNEKKMNNAVHLLGITGGRTPDVSAKRQGEVLRELASSLERGDPFTHGHTRRVTRYAYMLAKTMRLPKETVVKIRAAAAVHDVGKIDTPPEILNKPGRLTDEEFDVMKRHSARGAEMVARFEDPEITAMVRHHHERIDGRGYPDNLKGDQIPLGARVIAVADTFDAIISTRPYRDARSHREGIEILKRAAGTQLDEDAVDAFLSYYGGRKPLAWWLSVSSGVQRVLGGFGGWLQHAKAASFSQGATSLGATIAMTTAMATVAPTLGVGQHSGPALPKDKPVEAIVADAGGFDEPAGDDGGAPASHDDDRADASNEDGGSGTPRDGGGASRAGGGGSSTSSSGGFVAEPTSDDGSEDDSVDHSDDSYVPPVDDGSDDTTSEPIDYSTPDQADKADKADKAEKKRRECRKDDRNDDEDDNGIVVTSTGGSSEHGGDADKGRRGDCKSSKDDKGKPGDEPGKPGDKPGKPGDKPGKGKPGDEPGKPGDEPGKPGDKPGKGKPGDEPGKGKPGDEPGKPGDKPGKGKPGDGGVPGEDDETAPPGDEDADPPVDEGSAEGDEVDVEVTDVDPPADPATVETVESEPEAPTEADSPPVEEADSPPADATVPVDDDEEVED